MLAFKDLDMIDNQRRNLLLGALLAPLMSNSTLAASASGSMPHAHAIPSMGSEMDKVKWMGDEQIGMLVYPGMTVMDLIGPHCMFGSLMSAKIYIIAK